MVLLLSGTIHAAVPWSPSRPVKIVVPAGEGGGADLMARLIAEVVEKRRFIPHRIQVVNKPGGSGAEGYLHVSKLNGDDHTLLITLSNIFTLPIALGAPYHWNEMTPVARLGLDEFILWVHSESPYANLQGYLKDVRSSPEKFRMGGTGVAQEDQIVTILIEQTAGVKFAYVPLGGGGSVAHALSEKKVDSTVNNPSEARKLWKEGSLRPLAVLDKARIESAPWNSIPTLKEKGLDVSYLMLRGIFAPPGVGGAVISFYQDLLRKVYDTEEFRGYLRKNALQPAWMTGGEFSEWLAGQDELHRKLLGKVGLK
ncbi:MAG: hypothetical protein A2902_01170 [Elusimicrobia bacterium RIFCSPLOWO2_01_FULL_64_13]|nr:MAG: hypothetical protein A2902_01170 [Elusimicrobia bacterium RIFCSPLOWO2_01_FULL_64_13]